MPSPRLASVLHYLRGVVAPAGGPLGDACLIERFLVHHDETAFETLVGRHGPMVLGVARSVLNDAHAAEDVFQATFLVLARKAHALCKRDSLASWLYGVAYRIACNARAGAARRRKHESRIPMPATPALPDETSRELRPLLVEELNSLPEKYRAPLILCYLEGKTNEEAAAQLHWPSGTVKGRLARAHKVLRGRLAKRGLALTATALAAALANNGVSAAVPNALLDATVRTAVPIALGNATLASVAGPAADLARQALQQALIGRIIAAALLVAMLAAGASGAWWLTRKPAAPPIAQEPETRPIAEPQLLATFAADKRFRGQPLPLAFSADGKRLAVLAQRDIEPAELFLQEIVGGATAASIKLEDSFRLAATGDHALALVHADDDRGAAWAEIRDLASLKVLRQWKNDKPGVLASDGFLAGDKLFLVGGQAAEQMAPPANNFGGGGGLGGGGGGFPGFGGFPFAGFGPGATGVYDLRGKYKQVVRALAEEDTLLGGQAISPAGKLSTLLLLQRDDDTRVEVFDPLTGTSRKLVDNIEATALAASADGTVLAVQTAENRLQLYNAVSGKPGPVVRDGDTTIVCFVFSPDGRILATAGSDRRIKLWDARTGQVARQISKPRVQRLLFSNDGRLLVSASPEEVKVWALKK